jgi:4-amino-4-deoxy-L-arabinose transferase-like glycosyltransferase
VRALLLVAAVGFVMRLAAVIPLHAGGQTSDEKEYLVLAHRLASGQGFVDSDGEYSKRYPLFPSVLAVLLKAFGDSDWLLYTVNALFGAVVVLFSGLLSEALWKNAAVARATAWAVALYPGLIAYGAVLQTESLYTALLLGGLLAAYRLVWRGGRGWALGLGLTAGLAVLTRAVFLGFFPVLLVLLAVVQKRLGRRVGWTGLTTAALAFVLVLTPWTWRNYQVHHALVPISSLGGQLVLLGNNPHATGTWSTGPGFEEWYRGELQRRGIADVRGLSELERADVAARIGWDYATGHPLEEAVLAIKKIQIFWFYPITTSDSAHALQAVAMVADVFLYLSCMLGLIQMWKPQVSLLPVAGALLVFALTPVLLHSEARYRLPLVPLLCLFAGWAGLPTSGVEEWKELVRRKRGQLRWVIAGTLAVIGGYAVTAWMVLSGHIS